MKQKLTPTLLAAVVASVLSTPAMSEIIISQYVEGSNNNKAIEIANTGEVSVELDGYSLAKSINGGGDWDSKLSLDGKVIQAKSVLVIGHTQSNEDIKNLSDFLDNDVLGFNGNDPVALLKGNDVHDVIGDMGGNDFAKDVTLTRSQDDFSPSSHYQASNWLESDKNDIQGLGELNGGQAPEPFACEQDGHEPVFTSIQEIQGEGSRSPLLNNGAFISDDEVYVKGIVSAVTSSLTKGFYLQALNDDGNPKTSEGLFVETNQSQSELKPGDLVCVKGKVQENYQQTQLKAGKNAWVKQGEHTPPVATEIDILADDASFEQSLERYEGMLVKTSANLDMRVTRTFGYDYAASRNNMVLAQGGINMHPNQAFAAGSDKAKQQSKDNSERRLFIESDHKAPNGVIPYYPEFGVTDADQNGSTEDYIRIGDTIVGLEGVLSYSYGDYRLITTNTLSKDNFIRRYPRTQQPEVKEKGDLRIATFNVLNYFNSPFGGDTNPNGGNRGAKTYPEFEIQQAKIVNAILRLDADIIGLMEIENNGLGENGAIGQLVEQLNQQIDNKKDRYKFVALDTNGDGIKDKNDYIGTDAITTGVLYRFKSVELQSSRVIEMPSQQAPEVLDDDGKVIEDGKNYQRNTLAPTFRIKSKDQKQDAEERITVAVNHFKSKGSKCWEDAAPIDEGGQGGKDVDQQGSCENFRVAAAVALGEALEDIPGHKVILGDLNAYGKEDPMLVLTDYSQKQYGKVIKAARNTYIGGVEQFGDQGEVIHHSYGYINAVAAKHPNNWSFSYNDEVGALDHILISPSLEKYVVDATEWHINGGESTLFEYSDRYTGDLPKYTDHFRSSDHDPAVLELKMAGSFGLGAIVSLFGLALWRRRK
ncbi:ExeM/NucH family extracellular endonuclease [Vibrio aquimaris]|uniref:Endonuclease/Exonuclease/phosphatase family protein n=1 Tax=Vibrio aquimaris TaxID=2587862 RepID=A0A5P9CM96_9VIBR|nr:ExeM/NucH family extracellular endonuclease [Vibrio aquimaris]QFT27419.1 Endonuclease/Exonuclease/phosphatase family protein [Vibrio aquimaris]